MKMKTNDLGKSDKRGTGNDRLIDGKIKITKKPTSDGPSEGD